MLTSATPAPLRLVTHRVTLMIIFFGRAQVRFNALHQPLKLNVQDVELNKTGHRRLPWTSEAWGVNGNFGVH